MKLGPQGRHIDHHIEGQDISCHNRWLNTSWRIRQLDSVWKFPKIHHITCPGKTTVAYLSVQTHTSSISLGYLYKPKCAWIWRSSRAWSDKSRLNATIKQYKWLSTITLSPPYQQVIQQSVHMMRLSAACDRCRSQLSPHTPSQFVTHVPVSTPIFSLVSATTLVRNCSIVKRRRLRRRVVDASAREAVSSVTTRNKASPRYAEEWA